MRVQRLLPSTSASLGLALATGLTVYPLQGSPLQREPNTTLRMPLVPGRFGYTYQEAFPGLVFTNAVALATPRGETNRLFVVEKQGRIVVITNLQSPSRSMFLDISSRVSSSLTVSDERGLLGLAFHPGYRTNRYFYVFYTGLATTPVPGGTNSLHNILSRFQTHPDDPNRADPNSELRLLVQRDEASNHNGGDLHFGPDGYLYVALGDEGGAHDQYANSQRIDKDYFAGILRIDVDLRPGSLPPNPHPAATRHYAVPPDNPFIGATTFNGRPVDPSRVRTEFWAVGLRNPWRMAFDPETGQLFCADVGQSTREEVNLIERGGNYGWSYWEGNYQRTNTALIPIGFQHARPVLDYGRNWGYSVTGGVVYRGHRFPDLHGAYIYGDYGSGWVWALKLDGTNVRENRPLFRNPLGGPFNAGGISAFGIDPRNGDVLYVDLRFGTNSVIRRIVADTNFVGVPLPPTLADTGAFVNTKDMVPAAGVVPYDLNLPFWSDGAYKTRWFSIPDPARTMEFHPMEPWRFPAGTVWIKHFELQLTNGVPQSARRLETRLLVFDGEAGYGVTYRWADTATNATLVPEEGAEELLVIYHPDGSVLRSQVWRYPSRVECLQCHRTSAGFALGFNTPQLHRQQSYGHFVTNQILALATAGYFRNPPTNTAGWRALAAPTDPVVSLEYRVRSWLAVNCAQCHHPGGVQMARWDARLFTSTDAAGMLWAPLWSGGPEDTRRIVVPGHPDRSELLHRISFRGAGQMPPIASTVVDEEAVTLLQTWIREALPTRPRFEDWQQRHFIDPTSPEAAPAADPDADGEPNLVEFHVGSDPRDPTSRWSYELRRTPEGNIQMQVWQPAHRAIRLFYTPSLAAPVPWTEVETPPEWSAFPQTARWLELTWPSRMPAGFYRVGLESP
ncbi:MAG: PQQ-dependent sugar dehydrogenase [Limisphaera sp.]|nr:PQQ-dependent sugar dehydrogenase [Limisphaera sp.]